MDDFFLPVGQRPSTGCSARGNMDLSLPGGLAARPSEPSKPPICAEGPFQGRILLPPNPVTLVEGAYYTRISCALCPVGLSRVDRIQRQRILKRNGRKVSIAESLWIPLEKLLRPVRHPGACDIILEADSVPHPEITRSRSSSAPPGHGFHVPAAPGALAPDGVKRCHSSASAPHPRPGRWRAGRPPRGKGIPGDEVGHRSGGTASAAGPPGHLFWGCQGPHAPTLRPCPKTGQGTI